MKTSKTTYALGKIDSNPNQFNFPFSKRALCAAICLSISSGAFANEQPQELAETKVSGKDESGYKVDKPASIKLTQDLIDTPKTLIIINESVLRDQGVTSLNDALRNVSGVSTFGAGEGGGGNVTTSDIATIRGFSVNSSIFIDGIRDISGYSRDIFNTEQIEVSKGANSSFAGKSSAGGSINLVTKRAKNDSFTNISGLVDSSDTLRLSVDHNTQLTDTISARINLLTTSGGDVLGNGFEDYKSNALASSVLFDISDKTDITFDLFFMDQDNSPVLGIPWVNTNAAGPFVADPDGDGPISAVGGTNLPEGPIDESLWGNYYGVESRDFEDVSTKMATLTVNHQFSNNLQLRSQTRFASNDLESIVSRARFNRPNDVNGDRLPYYSSDVDLRDTQNNDIKTELFITQLDLLLNTKMGTLDHALVVGVEFSQEELVKKRALRGFSWQLEHEFVDLINPITSQSHGNVVYWEQPESVEGTSWAIYALDTIEFNPFWEISAGLRYENYEAEGDKYLWRREDGNWVNFYHPGLKAESTFSSWHVALVHKPSENGSVYLGYANTQEPPGSELAFGGFNVAAVTVQTEFDPVESKNIELGVKWEFFNERLLLSSAYFLTTKTVVDRDADRNYFLSGEHEAKGIELAVSGKLSDNLEMIASYTHQKTEVTKDLDPNQLGDGLTGAPEDTANLWLTYQLGDLKVGGGAVYSSGDTYWRRSRAFFESGSSTLLNFMANYSFDENLSLQLNILNATDESTITDYSARGHFRPGNPREFKLSAYYQF